MTLNTNGGTNFKYMIRRGILATPWQIVNSVVHAVAGTDNTVNHCRSLIVITFITFPVVAGWNDLCNFIVTASRVVMVTSSRLSSSAAFLSSVLGIRADVTTSFGKSGSTSRVTLTPRLPWRHHTIARFWQAIWLIVGTTVTWFDTEFITIARMGESAACESILEFARITVLSRTASSQVGTSSVTRDQQTAASQHK